MLALQRLYEANDEEVVIQPLHVLHICGQVRTKKMERQASILSKQQFL
jgi:hypothetical protein